MSGTDKQKFIKKVEAWAQEKFGGSGDPEIEDAVDVVDYFTRMFGDQEHVFQKMLQDVCARIQSLDSTWTRDPCIQHVPDPPEEGETKEFSVAPWLLGFREKDAIKGKSKMPQIFKCLIHFLEKPFASAAEPLDVLMPLGVNAGSAIPAFSVRHNVGFARSLTVRIILFSTVDMRWDDATMKLFKKELQALTAIHCVYAPAADPKEQMAKALGDKMVAAERARPDVIQISHALQTRALSEGVELLPKIDEYLDDFQQGSVSEVRQFSALEISAVKLYPTLTEEGQKKLAYHYQAFDVECSAWPLSKLAADPLRHGTKNTRVSLPPDAAQLWLSVLTPSPHKREACIVRRIGVFIFKLKEASRTKKAKNINLRFLADNFRCRLSDDLAFEVAALFTHWAPTWQSMMTQENWAKCVLKFKRGGLDAQLIEKCSSKVAHTATDFRFLQAFGSVAPQMPIAQDSLDAQQEAAQQARERAELEEIKLLVSREENKWLKHKSDVTAWKCQSQAQRSAFKEEERKNNQEIVEKEMNLRYPGRDLKHASHIQTFVNSSIDAWLVDTTSTRDDAYIVWLLNLSIPGHFFMHSALTAITKAAESISVSPEKACAIIICPNTGVYGDSYNDATIMTAANDVEDLLKDPDLGIMYRPVSLTFDESTIPQQSSRPGQHSAFFVLSSAESSAGKPRSHFVMSKLWIRKCVPQIPIQKLKDSVNPLAEMPKGDFNPEKDLSKSQRRKQWFAGWKFAASIRGKLWQGMPVATTNYAAWIDVYGYDFSLGQCVQRSAFGGDSERLRQPTEMVCSLFWADIDTTISDHNDLLLSFHHRACRRSLKQLLREKTYFLEGWAEAAFTETGSSPAYKPSEYKATFPAASGDLPFRQEWVMLMQDKFKTSEVAADFQAMVENHDKKFNPSRELHSGETLKRKAASAIQKPNADEIPYEEGAPDTKEKFLEVNKNTLVLEAVGQEFLFTQKGELWCHGKVDDVVDTKLPIALIYGFYKLGANAEAEMSSGKALKFEIKASSDCVQCSSEVKRDACPEGLAPIADILAALDNPKVECHEVEPKFTKDDTGTIVAQDYDIKCTKLCSYTPQKIPKEFNEDWENAATRLFMGVANKNWDMTTLEHKLGKVVVKWRLTHQDSNQFQGINPSKPGIFLKAPVKVKEGTLRRWA